MESRLSTGAFGSGALALGGGMWSAGWVAVRLAGARRAVRLICADPGGRRTVVRRGVPLSKIGRGQPGSGGLLIAQSRVPRAWPGRHRPSRRVVVVGES